MSIVNKIFAIAALVFFNSAGAFADVKAEVCVKFRKDYGWSSGYKVQGTVINGLDLNSKVGSISRFKAWSSYLVVFWGEGQASIFELPPYAFNSVPMFETEVEDQQGRKWKIQEGHTFCY